MLVEKASCLWGLINLGLRSNFAWKRCNWKKIDSYLHRDTMVLEAEVIELGENRAFPLERRGGCFWQRSHICGQGVRLRGILAIGKQDVRLKGISPLQEGVYVLGASSDHLILDLEELAGEITIGSTISFKVDYGQCLLPLRHLM